MKNSSKMKIYESPDDDELEKARADVEKSRDDAIVVLSEAEGGFALFTIKTDKKGNSIGVLQIVSGLMGVEDTIQLASSMRGMSEKMLQQMLDGMRAKDDKK